MPTAANDSQKPGCSVTSGSKISTALKDSNKGQTTPRCRKRKRHSSTIATITQARRTGTSKPASSP